MSAKPLPPIIYYDGECPFCNNYVYLLEIKKSYGDLKLVNLRQDMIAHQSLINNGYNIDNGMVFEIGGKTFFGADAVNKLAIIGTSKSLFNKINKTVFSNKFLAKLIYPILVLGRKITLKILGRSVKY